MSNFNRRVSSPQAWKKKRSLSMRPKQLKSFKRQSGFFSAIKNRLPQNFGKKFTIVAIIAVIVFGFFSLGALAWIARDLPNPNKIIDRSIAFSTKIYDRTGETLLYDIHGSEQRTFIKLEEVPQHLINATLTAEDRNFYDHRGISITGIIRSALKNTFTGSRVGGSTLTQQLVKNAILTPEKTYTRKIKEVILSYQIERRFSKDEILQMYFNEIPYGSVAYGAEAAAHTYYGKSVQDLSLAEAAILAAMTQAPTYYSPYGSHTDALFARQQWVLNSMADLGHITKEEAEAAINEEIKFKEIKQSITAPHFVMYVREYLTEKYGELAVEQEGLTVITTLDLYKQEIAEEVVAEYGEKNEARGASNAALVALDPKTGQILSMVGSRDYFNDEIDGQVNVTIRPRQPGSSFKPIVYAAALDKGYTPDTVLYDVVTKFINVDGRDYEPHNYDLNEHGAVTMRKALAGSLNISAVKTIYLAGIDKVLDLADALGYTTLHDRSRFGLSLVLGGGEVKLLEHVNAFSVFARDGKLHPIAGILEIRDRNGNVLEKFEENEKQVLSSQVARQMNSIMSDNAARAYVFGNNNSLTLGSRPVAAKTGTTNDYKDAWTVGYTPSLAAGVWVGNNDNTEMNRGADGSIVAAPIWQAFMNRVLGDTPIESFAQPDPIETDKAVLNGATAGEVTVKIDRVTGKLATEYTPESQIEEKTFRETHSILHYINKDDPRGDTPPDHDSEQYKRWEEAIVAWAEKNEIVTEAPPTDYDDIHVPENRPEIEILTPSRNQTFNTRSITASVSVSAPRGVSRVEYYLDNTLLQTVNQYPFNLNTQINITSVSKGVYPLTAIAYDDVDNQSSDSVQIIVDLPPPPTAFNWLTPENKSNITADNFPLELTFDVESAASIEEVAFYYRHGGNTTYLNTVRQLSEGQNSLSWTTPPSKGTYYLWAEINTKNDGTYQSKELIINVN